MLIVTGAVLLVSEPVRNMVNPFFWIKMSTLLVTFLLTLWFQFAVSRRLAAGSARREGKDPSASPQGRSSCSGVWSWQAGAGSPTRRFEGEDKMLQSLWQALEGSGLATSIASGEYAFPLIETFHVIAIVTVFGTIAIMDLRLLGLTSGKWSITSVSQDTLRLTWGAFGLAVITGLLMFISKGDDLYGQPLLPLEDGADRLGRPQHGRPAPHHLEDHRQLEYPARLSRRRPGCRGALSLAFWIVVIFCGRFIGFTLGVYQPPL